MMEWILHEAEKHRVEIRSGAFFGRLRKRPDVVADLHWLGRWSPQLLCQSLGFTRSLCLRYALCSNDRLIDPWCRHASEEIDHPAQLRSWMASWMHDEIEIALESQPTAPTLDVVELCWNAATDGTLDIQIAVNVISEGVALDFFTAAIPFLDRLRLHYGPYWSIHREIDNAHLRLGVDALEHCEPTSIRGQAILGMLRDGALAYHKMLESWAALAEEP